jgi:copper chaperone CopZ
MNTEGKLQLNGANCPSCAYAIEKHSRKIPGIEDVHVDVVNKMIHVKYDGETSKLEKIAGMVKQLGYHAEVIE